MSENSTMVGVGMSMEGIEQNPIVYDLMSEMAFQRKTVDVEGGPTCKVPTGRRDGSISNVTEANNNIPGPNFNFTRLQTNFANQGLNLNDLVLLSSVPRVNTPPPLSGRSVTTTEGGLIAAPKPLRIPTNIVNPLDEMSQPWTRSPTKSKMEPLLATW